MYRLLKYRKISLDFNSEFWENYNYTSDIVRDKLLCITIYKAFFVYHTSKVRTIKTVIRTNLHKYFKS